ncbi:methyltransferase-like protein 17, mitochondrial isoform X5 [Dermochelys coriacea]|uniref:methyltransferase-like protein 17, mitochondrial isoform X5 n=1 Tax=Dermochelys coriacea TaxID=27794 RepID=UPI001CA9BC54|nr:methyltransferase-like protein 17, mitochondrial isoform X5 [Dermochelys coriacea]
MEPLLAVKFGCVVALLLITLVCGLIPAQVKWFQIKAAKGRHRRILSYIGCFAAGVFLGACLMHTAADALTDIQGELSKRLQQAVAGQNLTGTQNNSSKASACGAELDYPFAELVISLGFFLVFLTESLVLHCCHSAPPTHGAPGKDPACSAPSVPSVPHSHGVPVPGGPSPGSFRALVLFITLSLHSLFEGLAVGVQQGEAGALQLCLAVLVHKGVIAFSLGLQLVQSGTRPRCRLLYLGIFALMSPSGMAVGIGLSLSGGAAGGLAMALLEGVAAGTFLYITFLEILPHELSSREPPLAKFSFIALGFTVMATIAIWA